MLLCMTLPRAGQPNCPLPPQVTTTTVADGVAWELPPAGIRTYGSTGSAAPPVPLPYPGGGGFRVAARVQQQLTALFGNGSGGFGNGGGDDGQQHQQGCLATPNDWCEIVQVGSGDGADVLAAAAGPCATGARGRMVEGCGLLCSGLSCCSGPYTQPAHRQPRRKVGTLAG